MNAIAVLFQEHLKKNLIFLLRVQHIFILFYVWCHVCNLNFALFVHCFPCVNTQLPCSIALKNIFFFVLREAV